MICTETDRHYSIYGTCLLPRITGQEQLTDTVLAWDCPNIIGLLFRDGQYKTFRRPTRNDMEHLAKLLQIIEPPLDVPILDKCGYIFEECVQIVAARSPTLPIPAIAVTVVLCFAPTVLDNVGLVDTGAASFSELDWWLYFIVLPLTSAPFMYLRAKASLGKWRLRLSADEAAYLEALTVA